MSRQRILEEFLSGKLDRRSAAARLVAVGMSAAAAAAYVSTLTPVSAFAGPAPSGAGVIARYQQTPGEDYGTAFSFATPEEAIGLLLDEIQNVLGVLAAASSFDAAEFDEPEISDHLQTINAQLTEHADALAAVIGGTPPVAGAPQAFGTVPEFLQALAAALDDLAARYAAVAPAIGDGADRQTITEAAIAVGGYRALIRHYAKQDPCPESFTTPAMP